MADVNDFFSSRNTVTNISENERKQMTNYLETIKAFARTTYKSIYVIDYEKKDSNMFLKILFFYVDTLLKKCKKWDTSFTLTMLFPKM
nr:hypothetical protein BACY1_00640 [Tenacibaculum mesophilum]